MTAPDINEICDDLAGEHADLDALVAPLDASQWDLATPAAGWAIRDQIHHLAWFDRDGVLAIEDPDAFNASMATTVADFDGFEARLAAEAHAMPAGELLAWRRAPPARILHVMRPADPSLRVPWASLPMARSSL